MGTKRRYGLLSDEQVQKHRKSVLKEVSRRVHGALLAVKGTSGTPSRSKVSQGLSECLEYIGADDEGKHADTEYFFWNGMLIHLQRDTGPLGDTFTVYVPATEGFFWAQKKEKS